MLVPLRTKEAVKQDLWREALANLNAEDQKQYQDCSSNMLEVLRQVQEATNNKKELCLSKGWKIYRNKQGEEVKLRHVLEKVSKWVKGIIKVVDSGVSFDQSGHAALPWAIVGDSNISLFSGLVESIESTSSLIARYVIVEKLYLSHECEATPRLQEAIGKLYIAVLTYLAKVKAFFTGGTWKRLGQGLLDILRSEYKELSTKISETQVEHWTKLVETERKKRESLITSASTYGTIVNLKAREGSVQLELTLRETLAEFSEPIMQMSDQIAIIHDNLDREERKKTFRWMSEVEYRSHHEDLSRNLLFQSGKWLLESQDFIEWSQSSVSSILWLHGIHSTYVTTLLIIIRESTVSLGSLSVLDRPPMLMLDDWIRSTVVNLMLRAGPDSTAFFYCARSTAEPARAKPVEVLCALLRQLCSSKPDQPVKGPVAREYEARKQKAKEDCSALKRLTVNDCTSLIIELAKDQPAMIILDALDECEECTRHELLEAFNEIVKKSVDVVKIFVSSRDDIDIVSSFY
ncbi:hypothetical protein MMC21_000964 [Puttea exsequens]|nr:hypothetical protein [Puttea exsequens]